MSKPIRGYPKEQRRHVVARRLKERHGGLGYLSAKDYLDAATPNKVSA